MTVINGDGEVRCGILLPKTESATEPAKTTKKTDSSKILMIFFSVYAVTLLLVYGITGTSGELSAVVSEKTESLYEDTAAQADVESSTVNPTEEYENKVKAVVSTFMNAYDESR